MIFCKKCGKYKDENSFYRRANGKIKKPCSDCERKRRRDYYKVQPYLYQKKHFEPKVCLICRSSYVPVQPHQKYCSCECIKEKCRQRRQMKKQIRLIDKICSKCGKQFMATRITQKYCCSECRRNKGRRLRPSTRFLILTRDKFRCQYCGAIPENGANLVLVNPHYLYFSQKLEDLFFCSTGSLHDFLFCLVVCKKHYVNFPSLPEIKTIVKVFKEQKATGNIPIRFSFIRGEE
jgi:hypothetical protein